MKFKVLILCVVYLSLLLNVKTNNAASYDFTDFPNATIVITWNNILLNAIHKASPPPTVVSRSLAMVHTAIYDAWASYSDSRGVYLTNKNNILSNCSSLADKENSIKKSISHAAYQTLKDLYPLSIDSYNQKMKDLGYNTSDTNLNMDNAAGVGNIASKLLLENRWIDGSNQKAIYGGKNYSDWTNYCPKNDPQFAPLKYPDSWQPLLVPVRNSTAAPQSFSTPHWGSVKPFALINGAQVRPSNPPPYALNNQTKDALIKSAWELVNYTTNLTDEIKAIAEYFGDGPNSVLPPGHWNLFAQYVSKRDNHTVEQDVKMYFMLNNAAMDSGIACWDCKRYYDNARPATMIPYLLKGITVTGWHGVCNENVTFDLKDWIPYQDPYVITPPFSDYVSGHSTFSSSAAEILKRFTGSDKFGDSVVIKAGSSIFETNCSFPVPRTDITLYWDTFTDAAQQACISRRYGGIHYDFSDIEARKMGRKIGELVWNKSQALFSGLDPNNSTVTN
ncbi:hypothetical protein DICPUDRAFT_152406 [Dictyostelium purpureum]|uniref:Phosphatidic acid phosphatase type 2/haloperoxidase domain-containing protein n=1 Tax=Dictyostelium purpureum TaxID=5786 RepID=F0ZL98_DICPU|nr:uncharacterized protein DICPUDRAFT_152406 [Dictyostelium purpureum]EGC35279.1 hypothetical protein DICPUDRAFT_152406 [Dictyostelium purpureum]|eukprot:XP_003288205.1 hypothetical protein DICPUDRAFT_152406 [Dictyostelium purpureum]